MNRQAEIPQNEVDRTYDRLKKEAESGGYYLNPDVEMTKELILGILTNQQRYGYGCCPCRLAANNKQEDLDIICPCDYRDPDLTDYDTCYCGLYVSQAVVKGEKKIGSIPERRPPPGERAQQKPQPAEEAKAGLAFPVWRCRVCGYLCARDEPPEICPVCKARKERFERFM